eukprot:5340014-Karenia_brevis.AAC.1
MLGRPLLNDPDKADADDAAACLKQGGIDVSGEYLSFTSAAAAMYAASPWSQDRPLDRVFVYDGEGEAMLVGGATDHPSAMQVPVDTDAQ